MRPRHIGAWRNLLLLGLAALLAAPALTGSNQPYIEGDKLTFAFLDLEGRTVRSSDPEFRGKVLLVDLSGGLVPPCLSEIPTLIDLQQRLGEKGLVIVTVAFESEDEEGESRRNRLEAFVGEQGINYRVLDGREPRDSDEPLPTLKNVQGFPVEILIARDGTPVEVRNGRGYSKRWARKLERELVELLDAPSQPGQRESEAGAHQEMP